MRSFYVLIVLGFSLIGSAVAAPPPPPPTPMQLPVYNDGYVFLNKPYKARQGLVPMFCPIGSRHNDLICGENFKGLNSSTLEGREFPMITAQDALDRAYGKGKLKVVGLSPYGYTGETAIVYYKILE